MVQEPSKGSEASNVRASDCSSESRSLKPSQHVTPSLFLGCFLCEMRGLEPMVPLNSIYRSLFIIIIIVFLSFLGPHLWHVEVPSGPIGATADVLPHSHSNVGSKPRL